MLNASDCGSRKAATPSTRNEFGRAASALFALPWFLDQADRVLIFDNSGSTPRIIA
jgi:predicted ABC-type ATPase